MNHYFLWAVGKDHPGFVAEITKTLYELNCNLEDSSMMRLGSEFAIFLILTSKKSISENDFSVRKSLSKINLGIKKISARDAKFIRPRPNNFIVRVHGHDQPGIVYHVTHCLAKHAFNITDLSTHRTTKGSRPGYILLLEGELLKTSRLSDLKKDIKKLSLKLRAKIGIEPLTSQSI